MLTKRYASALDYAHTLHASQRRKGTDVPYFSHLIGVSSLVLEHGGTETEAIAALLHDAVEDQGGEATLEEIRNRYGDEVALIVDGCTDSYMEPKPPWKERKVAYLAHLLEAPKSVLLVSCADKLHNARAILSDYRQHGEALWDRFNAEPQQILWYYESLAHAFKSAAPGLHLALELEQTVAMIREARDPAMRETVRDS